MTFNATGPVMLPPGGALVYDKDGERVEGIARHELIERLTELRRANNKRIGNPERDIDRFLTGQIGYSAPIPVSATTIKPQGKPRLIERVMSWLGTRYAKLSTIQYVNADEAKRRAVICLRCPKNQDWEGSCRTCNAGAKREINRNIIILSQNKQTPFHARLGACGVAGHPNKVAVWMTPEFLNHRVNYMDRLPDICWLKQL